MTTELNEFTPNDVVLLTTIEGLHAIVNKLLNERRAGIKLIETKDAEILSVRHKLDYVAARVCLAPAGITNPDDTEELCLLVKGHAGPHQV